MNRLGEVHRCRSANRSGVLAVCVLVCLTIAAAVMTITVRSALRARRHSLLEHQLTQTEWLLDAGVRRAMTKIQIEPDYQGETWNPVGALERIGTATVEIVISNDAPDSASAKVTATIVESSPLAKTTRRSHQFIFQPNSPDTSTAE